LQSGISGYYLQVGTTAGGSDKFDGEVGSVLSYSVSDCTRGSTYYAKVKAKSGSGLYSAYSGNSDGIKILCLPSLDWVGSSNFAAAGFYPKSGAITTDFQFKVKYTSLDSISPNTNYPKLHVKKAGAEINGSPFAMSIESGAALTGAVYTYTTKLNAGTGYTYCFEAQDCFTLTALGAPTAELKGPDVIAESTIKVTNNLFNPTKSGQINILYSLPAEATVKITVHKFSGELVRTILNANKSAGSYSDTGWDGKDDQGQIVSSGVYIVYIDAGNFKDKKKVIIAK